MPQVEKKAAPGSDSGYGIQPKGNASRGRGKRFARVGSCFRFSTERRGAEDGEAAQRATTLDGDALREYNQRGWLLKATQPDPDGAGSGLAPWTVFTYDAAGNVLTETDRLGNAETYRYDNLHRLVEHEDAKAGLTHYAYDQFGNRASLTDPLGNTTSWTYDSLDRVTGETNSLSATRQFAYDAASNLTSRTDRNGRVTEYGFDNLDRRIEERWLASDGLTLRTLSWSYDAASNLLSASDPAAAYSYQYDNLGRNTSTTHNLAGLTDDVVMGQEYDALGRRTALAATIGGTADFRNAYQHDYLNRMTRITQAAQSGGHAVAEKRIDLAYDADDEGQWTSITRYADLAGTQTVATTGYSYDQTDRLTGLTHSQGATTLADYGWTYDAANRLTQFTSLADGTSDYTYDSTDQVTGATHSYQADEGYTYDANGNRTNTGYSTGSDNRLLSDGTYDYTYDAEGNRTKKTEIATGEATEYTWDHRNRLVKVVHLDSSGNRTQTLDYAYDVFDRRIGKSDTPAVGPAYLEDYVYDGEHLALEFEAGQLANRYLHGPAIDQILADEQVDSLTSPGEVIWPLTDNLGTVRNLAKHDAATGTTTVANHIAYDAFGQVTSETDAAVDHLFGYTGREWDADADLQYNRARWYDPAVGRWLSQDPIGFSAGDANLYRYVGNGPTNKADPSGLEPPTVWESPAGLGDGVSIGAAPPEHTQWWSTIKDRLSNRKPLITDPRAYTEIKVGGGTYVSANSANAGWGYWLAGNLWHRTPVGSVCDTGLRMATNPINESSAIISNLYGGLTNIHQLPETWSQLPDYQKQDIGINTLLGIGAGNLPYGQISTLNKLNTRVMTRAEWQAYSRAQRAYANGLTPVSRWGRPGLYNGAWVMQGEQTAGNYICSFKWQPGFGNQFAGPGTGATYYVPQQTIVWPSGWGIDGRLKGLFGQRIYLGPETKLPVIQK